MLYCVQPLLPSLTRAFAISPAAASLSLSAATGVLAVAMIFAGTLSDALGRKTVMTASLAAAAAATLAASFSPNWTTFVALRALTGRALSGVPAVAMAYLVEEVDRSAIGFAMGLYIAGTTLGGLGGRLATAAFAEAGWREAVLFVGLISLASAAAFAFVLPRERRIPQKTGAAALLPTIAMHFSDPGLRYLFAMGFLLMGAFVTTYNYIGFRLETAPFLLSQTTIGFVYCLYLIGTVASPTIGELANRYGRRRVIGFAIAFMPIGVLLTLPDRLWLAILGVGVLTIGFFGGHTIASSWVGLRAETGKARSKRDLPLLLLRRLEPGGLARRLGLHARRMARPSGIHRLLDRGCAPYCLEAGTRGAACAPPRSLKRRRLGIWNGATRGSSSGSGGMARLRRSWRR